MTDSTPAAGPVTIDDVRAALAENDPSGTNAGALRKVLGRGSLSTIQKHLDAIRAELAAPALQALGAAPDAPKELVQAVWVAAWTAAQARTAGALAEAQALATQQAQALATARADALAALQIVDDAQQELADQQKLAQQQADEAAQVQQELATLRQELQQQAQQHEQGAAQAAQAQALERARAEAIEATLRGEIDRQISQLADLRAALGVGSSRPEAVEPAQSKAKSKQGTII